MKKSMHINGSIPVTITHVKENRKTVKKGGYRLSITAHQVMMATIIFSRSGDLTRGSVRSLLTVPVQLLVTFVMLRMLKFQG